MWWQLDDCWPSISWAVIYRAGRRKPSWYAIRRSFPDRLVVLQPSDDAGADLALINDTADVWEAATVVQHITPTGVVLDEITLDAAVGPRSMTRLTLPPGYAIGDGLTVATAGGGAPCTGGRVSTDASSLHGGMSRLMPPRRRSASRSRRTPSFAISASLLTASMRTQWSTNNSSRYSRVRATPSPSAHRECRIPLSGPTG